MRQGGVTQGDVDDVGVSRPVGMGLGRGCWDGRRQRPA